MSCFASPGLLALVGSGTWRFSGGVGVERKRCLGSQMSSSACINASPVLPQSAVDSATGAMARRSSATESSTSAKPVPLTSSTYLSFLFSARHPFVFLSVRLAACSRLYPISRLSLISNLNCLLLHPSPLDASLTTAQRPASALSLPTYQSSPRPGSTLSLVSASSFVRIPSSSLILSLLLLSHYRFFFIHIDRVHV